MCAPRRGERWNSTVGSDRGAASPGCAVSGRKRRRGAHRIDGTRALRRRGAARRDTMAQVTTTNGGFLGHVQDMLNTHPGKPTYDRALLLECIEACFDCAQACVSCADACIGERDPAKLT